MADAISQVKHDLGRDAVILHTRSFRKGGLLGLIGGRYVWEVTASPTDSAPPRTIRVPSCGAGPTPEEEAIAIEALGLKVTPPDYAHLFGEPSRGVTLGQLQADALSAAPPGDELNRKVAEIREMVELLVRSPSHASAETAAPAVRAAAAPAKAAHADASDELPRQLQEYREHLLGQDVEAPVADRLMHELTLSLAGSEQYDSKMIADRLCDLIASRIRTAGPVQRKESLAGKPRVIALVGPTGVGKTTTIAKLAADFKLRRNLRVGLVTIDTYRIAAVDQLRTYAEIIEVPIRTVLSAGDLHQAIYGMADVDVVLIDTAGRSHNDQPRLNQLQSFLATAQADEIHLVVAANASLRCMRNILARFGAMNPNRIILSKLDEAETFGTILSLAEAGAPALSFATTGQDVPDDIEAADPWRLAQRVLKGKTA